jgi:hypothetical protein
VAGFSLPIKLAGSILDAGEIIGCGPDGDTDRVDRTDREDR